MVGKGRLIFCIVLLVCFSNVFANNPDSLIRQLKIATDTSKASILAKLADFYLDSDSAKAWKYLEELNEFSVDNDFPVFEGKYYLLKGEYFKYHGDLSLAMNAFLDAKKVYDENNLKSELAGSYNNLGVVCIDKADYPKSVEYFLKALSIYEELLEEKSKARVLLNLGLVFYYQKNYKLALEYYYKSLKIREKFNDKKGIALAYNNIGIVHYFTNNTKGSLESFKKALKIYEELGSKRSMSLPLFNIAEIYYDGKQYDSALIYFNKSYTIDTLLKDKISSSKSLIQLAAVYLALNEYEKAIMYAQKGEILATETNSKEDMKDAYRILSNIYSQKNNLPLALKYSELCSNFKDSLFSTQSTEMVAELQTKYETEKKDLLLGKQSQTIQSQKLITKILIIGILLAAIFITLVLVQYIQKKRAFKVLEFQKKNITDSINYASRIQSALLPPEELLNSVLPGHFILYMPRDIVSGDFYWITVSNERTIVAVADCTGHGVPGAFMSMLGFAFLNEIISKIPDANANEILNELRRKVKTSLHQSENSTTKDGMDIALAIIDPAKKQLQYAGANNPLILIRNQNIISLPPDKMPIGIHSLEKDSFTLKEMELIPGDTVYMFSDGYCDQFGGEKNKKLGKANFEKLLQEASTLNIKAQKYFLTEKILEWMAEMDQMDDILVMGMEIS